MADEADQANDLNETMTDAGIRNSGNSYEQRFLTSCSKCFGHDNRIARGYTLCEECFSCTDDEVGC